MTKGKLFQFAILWHPTEEEYKNGKRSTVVVPVETIIAPDQNAAAMAAAQRIPKEQLDHLDQVELVLQPF